MKSFFQRADKWGAVARIHFARCDWKRGHRAEIRRLRWIHRAIVAAGYAPKNKLGQYIF